MFARKRHLSLAEVERMHPRDFDTWLLQDKLDEMKTAQDARFGQLHTEHSELMGRR